MKDITPELKEAFEKILQENGNSIMWSHSAKDLIFKNMHAAYTLGREGKWIDATTSKPPVDETQPEIMKSLQRSIEVLTVSYFGRRLGTYDHSLDSWRVDGVSSSNGIDVTHFFIIPPQFK